MATRDSSSHLPSSAPSPAPAASGAGSLAATDLVAHLDQLLRADEISDYCPNGLQIEGRPEIRKVVTAVSACQELTQRAEEAGADALLVHHGLFWKGLPLTLTGLQYRRVSGIIRSGMNLIAYHLPLDRDLTHGNSGQAAQLLGLEGIQAFGQEGAITLGARGTFPEPLSAEELVTRCTGLFEQAPPVVFPEGPREIRTLGIVSGGGQRQIHEAIALGLDAYITGEGTEWIMNLAREAGIHFLACGHYATERLGVQSLGRHLAERFGLEVEYIDIPNPV